MAGVAFNFQHVLLLVLMCCSSGPRPASADCFPPELQALRTFRLHLASAYYSEGFDYEPVQTTEWEGNDCCSWGGISCSVPSSSSGGPPRVSGLSLSISRFSNLSYTNNFLQPLCNLSLLSTLFLLYTPYEYSTRPDFFTHIPECIGHLSSLRNLSLNYFHQFQGPLPSFFSRLLHQLQYLSIPMIDPVLSGTLDLLPIVFSNYLPNLTYVDLSGWALSGPLPIFRTPFLQHLDLSDNLLNSTLLDFTLHSNLPSLTTLDLTANAISGSIPSSIARLSNLETLRLSFNSLSGKIPQSICKLAKLMELNLVNLEFNTSLDSLECKFINLNDLYLAYNNLKGPFPRWIGRSPSLQTLDLSGNEFRGPLPDEWKSLQKLEYLDLSGSSLLPSQLYHDASLPEWLFHFPLQFIHLVSCGLRTQDLPCSGKLSLLNQSLISLDLSDNHLTGPSDTLECFALHNFSQLEKLFLSKNPLSIVLSNMLLPPHVLNFQLSSCNLKGVDPLHSSINFIDLSHNALAMDLSSLLARIWVNCTDLIILIAKRGIDLSHNALVGEIPSSLGVCGKQFTTIKIDNNALVGRIPDELGGLAKLEILTLNNNRLQGTIPASIFGISLLALLDLSYNELEGNLNTLFSFPRSTTYLRVVLLSHNRINGSIPLSFGTFMPDLQLIDFSNNRLTGTIPQKLHLSYLRDLQTRKINFTTYIPSYAGGGLGEGVLLVVKGVELPYSYVLEKMTSLDLSCNFLEGGIPAEMGDLGGLLFLNLSHNNLSGPIPSTLAKLSQLQALDLSSNQLEGSLPSHLSNLTKLSDFDVSYNAGLRGGIPQGPQFEMSESYKGDPHLCGSPTLEDCKPSKGVVPHTTPQPAGSTNIIIGWIDEWIALPGLILGIVVGFGSTLILLHYKH